MRIPESDLVVNELNIPVAMLEAFWVATLKVSVGSPELTLQQKEEEEEEEEEEEGLMAE